MVTSVALGFRFELSNSGERFRAIMALLFCLPVLLFPFTVPCSIVFAKREDLETWPNHLSFCFLTMVSSLYSSMAD